MPRVATVDGVRVMFYSTEHPPPHFHAEYGGDVAVIDIMEARVSAGFLPVSKRRKLLAWTRDNRDKLVRTFIAAVARQPLERFE